MGYVPTPRRSDSLCQLLEESDDLADALFYGNEEFGAFPVGSFCFVPLQGGRELGDSKFDEGPKMCVSSLGLAGHLDMGFHGHDDCSSARDMEELGGPFLAPDA